MASLVILLVSADRVELLEDIEVGALLDIEGAQVMVVVLVGIPPGAEACRCAVAAIADLHIAGEMKFHMLMEMDSESVAEAEAECGR